jgi:hypothetical protein
MPRIEHGLVCPANIIVNPLKDLAEEYLWLTHRKLAANTHTLPIPVWYICMYSTVPALFARALALYPLEIAIE